MKLKVSTNFMCLQSKLTAEMCQKVEDLDAAFAYFILGLTI